MILTGETEALGNNLSQISHIIWDIRVKLNEFVMEYRVKWMTPCFGLFTLVLPSSGQTR